MSNDARITEPYRQATQAGGFFVREDRSIIEVAGADRAAWLSNLITNVVKTLQPGEGNYAFALNIKGRTIFDLNVLVLDDRLWLDVDRRLAETAMKHLERYIITEDVRIADVTGQTARAAVMGPKAHEVAAGLGFGNLVPMAQLQHVAGEIDGATVRMVRNDFTGLPCAEFVALGDAAGSVEAVCAAAEKHGLVRLDGETVEVLRIESGIPASVADIDEDVVPPETGQIERGINYHKGCYLGQEVIERMRSHGILARQFVGLKVDAEDVPRRGASIRADGKDIGRVTSGCWSEALAGPLALGYVKTPFAKPGSTVQVVASGEASSAAGATVVSLPVRLKA